MLPLFPLAIEAEHMLQPDAMLAAWENHVWLADSAVCENSEIAERCLGWLSPEERHRYESFVYNSDRQRYLTSRALVRAALSRYADRSPQAWAFRSDSLGRPEIVNDPRLHFSCSRTPGIVACIVGIDCDIGVDIEKLDPSHADLDIAHDYFAAHEFGMLKAAPSDQFGSQFLLLWTLKEAFVKALGLGLSQPLDSFAFQAGVGQTIELKLYDDRLGHSEDWLIRAGTVGRTHVLSAACRTAHPGLRHRCAWLPPAAFTAYID